MNIKYNLGITSETLEKIFKRLTNQVYKLLPTREEHNEWIKPLECIIEEFAGMEYLFLDHQENFFCLICKLEGLKSLTEDSDFELFRRVIFESLNLIAEIKKDCLV